MSGRRQCLVVATLIECAKWLRVVLAHRKGARGGCQHDHGTACDVERAVARRIATMAVAGIWQASVSVVAAVLSSSRNAAAALTDVAWHILATRLAAAFIARPAHTAAAMLAR